MCGRFTLTATKSELEDLFSASIERDLPPRMLIAPSEPILTIGAWPATVAPIAGRRYRAQLARWSFIPSFVKDPKQWPLIINIRQETVFTKKIFSGALKYGRIIIPATGFFEWRKELGSKSQPYFIKAKNKEPLAFAGLIETWHDRDGSAVTGAAILTRAANSELAAIHHRMPVIIDSAGVDVWLDTRTSRRTIENLLANESCYEFEVKAVQTRGSNDVQTTVQCQLSRSLVASTKQENLQKEFDFNKLEKS